MEEGRTAKHSGHNFYEAPLRLKLPGDKSLLLKVDAFILGPGIAALGGWASAPVELALEKDGEPLHLIKSGSHFRQDVNAFLNKIDQIPRGFGIACEFSGDAENLCLSLASRELNFRARLPLDPQRAAGAFSVGCMGAMGEEVSEAVRLALRRVENRAFARPSHVERAIRLLAPGHEEAAVLYGWLDLPEKAKLYVCLEGKRAKTLLRPYFWPRQDIEEGKGPCLNAGQAGHGFMAAFAGIPGGAANMELWSEKEGEWKRLLSFSLDDALTFRDFLRGLFSLPVPWGELAGCCQKVLLPLLGEIGARHMAILAARPLVEEKIGNPPSRPKTSLIIPLYGNLKFLATQIMCFSEDPEFRSDAEIIYVLDDPALPEEFRLKAAELERLFKLPFRWVFNGSNQGFAGANNLGASAARGDYLVFINSDVFPEKPGWISELREYLENNPDAGMAGCMLLRPSGLVQHAGLGFRYEEYFKIWTNIHPEAGAEPSLLEGEPREKPAVTGACLAIKKEFFHSLGGWDTSYLVGDFEDSDLCLKAREKGKKAVLLPHVRLTHLERQTFRLWGGEAARQRLVVYNAVAHQGKWGNRLAECGGNA